MCGSFARGLAFGCAAILDIGPRTSVEFGAAVQLLMGKKDPRIDAYIANAAPFAQPILRHIRKVVHAGCPEAEEMMKWSMPHFDYKGVLCGMAAHKQHCSLGFWKRSLVLGDAAADEKAMGQFGRITAISDLPAEQVLISYVRKAAELNDAGVRSPARVKPKQAAAPLDVPDYFSAALRKNKQAMAIFEGFSRGKRKDYVEWVTSAKREETRAERLTTAVEWIAEGKSRNWKYERKSG